MRTTATFDLEGTCIDFEPLHFLAYQKTCMEFGIELSAQEIAAIPGAVGGGRKFILAALAASYPEKNLEGFEARKGAHFLSLYKEFDCAPRDGLLPVLESLAARGIALAIGSSTARSAGEEYLARSGLGSFFPPEKCVFREDVSSLKPEGEVYIKTAALLSVKPEEQLIFEDSVVGVLAGRAAGSSVVAVPSAFLINERIRKSLTSAGAEAVFDSWKSLDISSFI